MIRRFNAKTQSYNPRKDWMHPNRPLPATAPSPCAPSKRGRPKKRFQI